MPADEDLVDYLDPLIAETAAVDLLAGPMPEAPPHCVAVSHFGSQASDDFTMGPSLSAPGSEIEDVQVMVRDVSRAVARAKAREIHALLDNLQSVDINGRRYFHVTSDGPPFCLNQDKNALWRYVANYHCRKVRG